MATAVEREAQAIKSEAKKILLIVLVVSLLVYAFTGTAQISQEETGLVIRLGKIIDQRGPGLYWGYPWPIDKVVRIPTGSAYSLEVKIFNLEPKKVSDQSAQLRKNPNFRSLRGTALTALTEPYLITADLNVVHLDLTVVYNITEPRDYYLAAGDTYVDISQTSVQQIARKIIANALIRAVASMEVMNVLGEGKAQVQRRVRTFARQQFKQLNLGIDISQADAVRITTVRVPTSLQPVFAEVTSAAQARANLVHIAEADKDRISNQAKADVVEINTDARIYSRSVVSQARGEAERFAALIDEYQKQGQVVRDRLRNEKLAEIAPYLKAPIIHTILDTNGKQRLIITVPAKPE